MSDALSVTHLKQQVEAAVMARGGKLQGHEIRFYCPVHSDEHPSADFNFEKAVWICRVCGESGNYYDLGRLLGIINNGHNPDGWQLTRQWNVGGYIHKRLEKSGEKKRVIWEGLDGISTADLPLYGGEKILDPTADVLVNEGEKSTDPLVALGFQALGTACGAQITPSRASLKPLAEHGGRVILCQDNDEPGKKHMQNIAARLKAMGKVAYLLEWPDAKEKGDAYDYIKSGKTAADVQAVIEAAKLYEGEAEMPEIIVNDRQLRDTTAEALDALYKSNYVPHIFRRSGVLTRIGTDEKGRPFAESLTEDALRGKLTRAANFIQKHESETRGTVITSVSPPLDVTKTINSLGAWDFPPLSGITESPVIRGDGTILSMPGHDGATGLYYAPAPGLMVPPIPVEPSAEELSAAASLIREVFCDFPYDGDASRAGAIAALLSPILRAAIDGPTPLPVIDKPQAGTGASLIADGISIVANGHLAATMGVPSTEEEWEKKLSSHLLAGRSLCVIDNIEGKLYSDTLSRYLTSSQISIRPLGRSADIILTNNISFIATGNNVTLGGDMPRRCFWIRLDAGEARPWMRKVTYKHPELREWIAANRGQIIAAILTIARGWVVAGRPVPTELPVLGGFESYSRTIGGVLAFIGVKGFMSNLLAMYDKMDRDTPQWENFLTTWKQVIGDHAATVAELLKKLNESEELAATLPDALAAREGKDYPRRVGNALAKKENVRFPSDVVLVRDGKYKHAVLWRVVSYETWKSANSPQISLGGELGELRNTPAHTGKEGPDSVYTVGGDVASPNSPPESKAGELTHPDYAAAFGMTIDSAIELWQSAGAPDIHLAQGVNCLDLVKFLSRPGVSVEHLVAIKEWLDQKNGGERWQPSS